jgi:hypothetical protein
MLRKSTRSRLATTSNIFQILGSLAGFIFFVMSISGVGQTMFPATGENVTIVHENATQLNFTISGDVIQPISRGFENAPLRYMVYASLIFITILSFTIAYIAYRSSKKR